MASEKETEELLKQAEMQLEVVSQKINEMLPRTRRKRSKKVKIEGPILSEDMGLEGEA